MSKQLDKSTSLCFILSSLTTEYECEPLKGWESLLRKLIHAERVCTNQWEGYSYYCQIHVSLKLLYPHTRHGQHTGTWLPRSRVPLHSAHCRAQSDTHPTPAPGRDARARPGLRARAGVVWNGRNERKSSGSVSHVMFSGYMQTVTHNTQRTHTSHKPYKPEVYVSITVCRASRGPRKHAHV